jgi:hypothetical protein
MISFAVNRHCGTLALRQGVSVEIKEDIVKGGESVSVY